MTSSSRFVRFAALFLPLTLAACSGLTKPNDIVITAEPARPAARPQGAAVPAAAQPSPAAAQAAPPAPGCGG